VLTLGLTNLRVEFPVLSVTNIKTTVTIPDGGTVLVGGLKRTVTQDAQVGIPSISRLPFLDFLLGRKGQARMQSNLFVLISSKITVIRDEESKRFN
jgi:type II secretory pathway component GspD/PulD (secretin)